MYIIIIPSLLSQLRSQLGGQKQSHECCTPAHSAVPAPECDRVQPCHNLAHLHHHPRVRLSSPHPPLNLNCLPLYSGPCLQHHPPLSASPAFRDGVTWYATFSSIHGSCPILMYRTLLSLKRRSISRATVRGWKTRLLVFEYFYLFNHIHLKKHKQLILS